MSTRLLKNQQPTLKSIVFSWYAPRLLQGTIAASCWICFGLILLVQATLPSIIFLPKLFVASLKASVNNGMY